MDNRNRKLIETIRTLIEEEFSGHIKINFSQGSIGRIEKTEEFEEVAVSLEGQKNDLRKQEKGEGFER